MNRPRLRLEGDCDLRLGTIRIWIGDQEITNITQELELHIGIDMIPAAKLTLVPTAGFGAGFSLPVDLSVEGGER